MKLEIEYWFLNNINLNDMKKAKSLDEKRNTSNVLAGKLFAVVYKCMFTV